jgi:hypothetical protein
VLRLCDLNMYMNENTESLKIMLYLVHLHTPQVCRTNPLMRVTYRKMNGCEADPYIRSQVFAIDNHD